MLEDGPLPAVPSQGNGGSGEILPLGHLFGALSARIVEDSREAMSLINGSPCASALVADAALSGRNRLARPSACARSPPRSIRTPDEQHSPLLETLWDEQHEVAALQSLRELLAGGVGERRHFQAPVSFRILPRVLGRLRRATAEAERAATSSLAAVSDNPVFVPPCEGYPLGATLSNGSYHNAQAPQAMDGLGMAWADLCQLLERQTERLLTDPTVFGEGHVPVKILYMVQTWWAEEARAAAQPTLIPLGGYGQNDTCAPSFFAWRRQEQVGRCLDAAHGDRRRDLLAGDGGRRPRAAAGADRAARATCARSSRSSPRRTRSARRPAASPRGSPIARWPEHERAVRSQHRARRRPATPSGSASAAWTCSCASSASATSCRRADGGGGARDRARALALPRRARRRALPLGRAARRARAAATGMAFRTLRDLYGRIDEHLWTLAGRAAQLVEWDRTHLHCGRCGTPTEHAPGRARAALSRVRPRGVPAPLARRDRARDARRRDPARARAALPRGMYSVLAGFVEPGESLEECVARELEEEVGIEVGDIAYFASQPWPFPHSLMIGFTATWRSGDLRIEEDELIDARWFTRDDLPELPGRVSIARKLIDDWL